MSLSHCGVKDDLGILILLLPPLSHSGITVCATILSLKLVHQALYQLSYSSVGIWCSLNKRRDRNNTAHREDPTASQCFRYLWDDSSSYCPQWHTPAKTMSKQP